MFAFLNLTYILSPVQKTCSSENPHRTYSYIDTVIRLTRQYSTHAAQLALVSRVATTRCFLFRTSTARVRINGVEWQRA